jgi:hypothetical protein
MNATATREVDDVTEVWVACGRCGGTGHYGGPVQGGKCFGCLDATGRPTGGEWITEAKAKARKAAAKRRKTARETKEAKRLAEFSARTDAAVAKLAEVGFTQAGDIMRTSTDPAESHAAQSAIFAVRDNGWDPSEAYAMWLEMTGEKR